jgi:Leucine-rich repeat (LRR) protein
MRRSFIILFCFCICCSFAQTGLLDSISIMTSDEYTDLKLALENKDKVVRLNLRKQKLKTFPIEILQLKNLQYLDLGKNSISVLPDSIVTLKKLQFLILTRNDLESLPKDFGELENLKYLIMGQNDITSLPYSFGRLEKLEILDIWDNDIDEFPLSMSNLKNLHSMDVRNIMISKPKQETLQKQIPNTKIYFSAPCNCGNN